MADPGDMSERYNTPLSAAEQKAYAVWLADLTKKQKRDVSADVRDYDMAGAFKAGEGPSAQEGADNGHFTDRFKKPSHPTFSDESQYHGKDGHEGGSWKELPNGHWEFRPGPANVKFHGKEGLQQYFRMAEPPEVKLILDGVQ